MSQNKEQSLQRQVDELIFRVAEYSAYNKALQTKYDELFKAHGVLAKHHCEVDEKLEEREAYIEGQNDYFAQMLEGRKGMQATIESLQLRVARLVDGWKNKAIELREEAGRIRRTVKEPTGAEERCNVRAEIYGKCAVQALTAEQDNEWLREHDAKVLEDAADWFNGKRYYLLVDSEFEITTESKLRGMASELRQPKKSPETDLDQALRLR
jgi:hypothetical protein